MKDKQTSTVPNNSSGKEITILIQDGVAKYRISALENSAKQFEEANPGVKVNVEKLAAPKGFRTALLERVQEKKPLDIIFSPFDPVLIEQNIYADLYPLFKVDKMTTDDLYERLVEMATVNGKLIGIPMGPQSLAVFYNKEWFDKAGLPYPGKEWTWEQFLTQSIKLQSANRVEGKELFGSVVPMDLHMLESLARSSGQGILSPDGNRLSGYLNSKPVVEAFAKLLTHMNTTKASKAVANVGSPVYNELRAFNAGMGIGAASMFAAFESSPTTAGKFGIAGLPSMEKGTKANAVYFNILSISPSSKQKELAWKFMKDTILNGDSQFQKDWGKQELLTVKSAVQKSQLHLVPGMDVLMNELNYAIKPIFYHNSALSALQISDNRLLTAASESEVLTALSELAEAVDKQLREKK